MQGYSRERLKSYIENSDARPYWMMVVVFKRGMPDACRSKDGMVRHFRDPFWVTGWPPCAWAQCACRVRACTITEAIERLSKNPLSKFP